MGWRMKEKPVLRKATREDAQRMQEMEPTPRANKLDEKKARRYIHELEMGTMRPVTWAIVYCLESKKWYRANANHTSWAGIKIEQFPDNWWITFETYEADTLEDVSRLFSTFDTRLAARKCNDIYRSFAGSKPELDCVANHIINLMASGLGIYEFGIASYTCHTAEERAELLATYTDFILWANKIFTEGLAYEVQADGKKANSHLRRAPVVAAMMHTWMDDEGKAWQFWGEVRDASHPNRNSQSRQLSEFLKSISFAARNESVVISIRQAFVVCLQAWDLWRIGKTTKLKYNANYVLPEPACKEHAA